MICGDVEDKGVIDFVAANAAMEPAYEHNELHAAGNENSQELRQVRGHKSLRMIGVKERESQKIGESGRTIVLTPAAPLRLNGKGVVRNRYVLQVLLATFGFGLILAVVAILQTPATWSQRGIGPSPVPVDSPQCHANKPPVLPQKATSRTDDLKDEC